MPIHVSSTHTNAGDKAANDHVGEQVDSATRQDTGEPDWVDAYAQVWCFQHL